MCVGYLAVLAAFVLLWLVILISGLWPGGGSCFLRSLPVCLRGRSISLLRGLALFLPDRIVAGSLLVILLGVTRCGRGFLRYHDFFIGYSRFFGEGEFSGMYQILFRSLFFFGLLFFFFGSFGLLSFFAGRRDVRHQGSSTLVFGHIAAVLTAFFVAFDLFDLFLFEVFFDCFDFFDFFFRFVHFFLVVPVVISIMVTDVT